MALSGARIVGGIAKGRILHVPKNVRPTTAMTRRVFADTYRSEIRGARILDLYAGAGVLTSELLSRGADRSVMVERSRFVARSLCRNLETLGFESRTEVLIMPAHKALRVLCDRGDMFDIVYADPPYAEGSALGVDSHGISAVLNVAGLFVFEQRTQTESASLDEFTVEWSKQIGDTKLVAYRRLIELEMADTDG